MNGRRWLDKNAVGLLVVAFAIFVGGMIGINSINYTQPPPTAPDVTPPVLPAAPEQTAGELTLDRSPAVPQVLHLPSIAAPIVPILLDGRELVPPSDPKVLGWWGSKAGAREGTTLLVGHTVHTGGGALDDLETIPVGSTARVSGVRYTVTSNVVMSKDELARKARSLFRQTGAPRLVVVTCEDYDPATGEYASNVVLIAN